MKTFRYFLALVVLTPFISALLIWIHTSIRPPIQRSNLTTSRKNVTLALGVLQTDFSESNKVGQINAIDSEINKYGGKCSCKSQIKLDKKSKERRRVELKDWERLHAGSREPLVRCPALSPFLFIGNGITVQPLTSTKLHGLSLSRAIPIESSGVAKIQLRCRNFLGVLHIPHRDNLRDFAGNNTAKLTIVVDTEVEKINAVLSAIRYESTVYSIESRDIIDVSWMSFHVSIHLHIKKQEVPVLYDPGVSGNINAKVTVVTKTFERHAAVKRLIRSVHKFYPNMTILIADDSEFPTKIQEPNVKHYTMPFSEGWFAGRNLLVSQVRTKYFLWVDDDFVFTTGTRLERFVEKFEHPNVTVDHVSGAFGDKFGRVSDKSKCVWCKRFEFQYGNKEGDCLVIKDEQYYHKVAEFPKCFWADATTNFFMARTSSARKIGFDPFFERVAHPEYFIDSLGKLRIMGCTDVNIMHLRNISNKKYRKFRRTNRITDKKKHVSFKNNLKCM
ncbi:beta-1,4 N-acetylgalactosaminyltransferase 1-like [Ptychodera flava]|uniref:beta-1,4 N-acetylgalactosaminyltransferase 1-like n=1 Tax=Ptychodera flava TaxID=63121 RepID=UPI003969D05B